MGLRKSPEGAIGHRAEWARRFASVKRIRRCLGIASREIVDKAVDDPAAFRREGKGAVKIAFFGGQWPLSIRCFETLINAGHELALVTMPLSRRRRLKQVLMPFRRPAIERLATGMGAPIMRFQGRGFESRLSRFAPDLICVAVFPQRIRDEISRIAPLGAINVHPSLLPRHRGNSPLFWLYHEGDLSTGVTVHRIVHRFDAGPVLAQQHIDVPRGYLVGRLARDLVDLAPRTLEAGIAAVAAGMPGKPQADDLATKAPTVDLSSFVIPFDRWGVEQAWHFLAGYRERYRVPLVDTAGIPVAYHNVPCFSREVLGPAGVAIPDDEGWRLGCRDGTVFLRR